MDQYISSYRKDYLWPYIKTYPLRSGPTYATEVSKPRLLLQGGSCMCGTEPGGCILPKEYSGPEEGGSYEWSRLGPMGPLLDPKLYPVNVGPLPESESTSFDQPNTYLKKLHEKYPYLYNVLQGNPPFNNIRRVNIDRLRTTYQAEFSKTGDHSWLDVEEPESSRPLLACPQKDIRPELDCRPHIRAALANLSQIRIPRPGRGSSDGKNTIESEFGQNHPQKKKKGKGSKNIEEDEISGSSLSSAWKSEYQGAIGETGQTIMDEKIHHFGNMSSERRKLLQWCTF